MRIIGVVTAIAVLGCGACGSVERREGEEDDGDPGDADGSTGDDADDGDETVTSQLEVTVMGEGAVTSDPAGIDCGETCSAAFVQGTEVTLTAVPGSSSDLVGWSGDCVGFGACTVTMDGARSLDALFGLHGSQRWVGHVSFAGQDFIESDVAVDGDGNPIIASTVNDGDGTDLYVAKHDRNTGEIAWSNHLQTTSSEFYGGLAVDGSGNVYAAMTILGADPLIIGGVEVTPDLFGNIIVLRLAAATGDVEWVRQWGGTAQDRPGGLAVIESDLFVVGETSSAPSDFDGSTISGSTGDGFLVRASTIDGGVAALQHFDGNFDLRGVAATDTSVAVAGSFRSAATIETPCSVSLNGADAQDGMVAQFTPDLACQWVQDFGDLADEMDAFASSVAPFPGGGWVLTGGFEGNVLFAESGSSLGSRGSFDAFAVRYAEGGDHVWSFRYGDTGSDIGTAIATTAEGHTVFTGPFASTITLGSFELTGADDVFVTRMSPGDAPSHEWAYALGGNDTDRSEGIALDAAGYVYVIAYFMGMTDVDGTPLTALD